ncbi:MAG: HAMP domain-containing protein [Solirubrobacterales bacterium]|nr:HAMP domain-containing protein [Solirubrobacterales bacterium]
MATPPTERQREAGSQAAADAEPRPTLARRIVGGVRARILASYVILLAIALLVSVLAVRQVLLVRLDDRIQEDLQQEVEEFRELVGGNDPETGRPFGDDVRRIFQVYLARNVPDDDEELITVPRRGIPRRDGGDNTQDFTFADFVDGWRTLGQVERDEVETPGGQVRYVAVPVRTEGGTLGTFVVASFVADERREVDEAVRIVAVVAAIVLVLGTVGAFFAAGRVLAPLRGLAAAARSVSGTQMDRRIRVEGDDELATLARTFNRMLDRLQIAFSSQREFIRDASHELRTPIAVSRGHLELLAEGHLRNESDRREAIALVTGELDRMNRFVEELLLLAKAESPNFLELETVPLGELCEELIAKARGIDDRDWRVDATSSRSIVADRQRLTQAAMNLFQNAIAHTEPGDQIAIGAKVDAGEAVIWVRDTGAGIPASEQGRIFQRFSRGLHSRGRYEGTGIGLAIVRAIAEAHGGRVGVSSRPGEGSRFEIVIPVEQQDPHQAWAMEVGR